MIDGTDDDFKYVEGNDFSVINCTSGVRYKWQKSGNGRLVGR